MAKKPKTPAAEPQGLADLVQDHQNARRHTERNLQLIDASLEQVGGGRSILIDETARILAGNATQKQALARGMKLKIVDADRDTIVAVRRKDLSAKQKTAIALFDNRAAEVAEWDGAMLAQLASEGADLDALFSADELAKLTNPDAGEVTGAGSLAERFGVPPFSVLDARQGYWQDRKRAWLLLGIQSELGRGGGTWLESDETGSPLDRKKRYTAAPGKAPRPAAKLKGGKTVRGDGRGRALRTPAKESA